jgi:hypothetical protein
MSDSNRDAYEQIGKEGGVEALSLVADIMESNAASTQRLMDSLYEGERAAHERTKERLDAAEAQLAAISHRLNALLYDPPGTNPLDTEIS